MMYRPPAVANNGMIVASHPLAVEAGAAMLRAGGHAVDAVIAAVKPHLRGWLHLAMAPLALLAGLVLIVVSDHLAARISAAVFTITAVLLFGVSAIYHRGTWGPKMTGFLKRFDHSNIFLIIAGSYTPFALLLPREPGAGAGR